MKKLMLCGIFLVVAQTLFAAPSNISVSGTVSHGESITISGFDLGNHANYNEGSYSWQSSTPLVAKFKDFNDGSITSSGWSNGFPAQNSVVSGGRSSGYYLREQYVSDERTQVQYNQSNATGEYFVSFWFMMPNETQAGKFWRIYGSSAAQNIYLSTGCSGTTIRGYSECTDSECSPETVWGSSTSLGGSVWRRVDVYMNDATNTFTVSVDGVEQFTKNDWVGNPFGGNGHTMDFGNMLDAPGASRCPANPTWAGSYNYDDIFVNYTRARVELCTGSIWANRGACELQMPTSWGTSSISATVNTGAFSEDDTAYLYIVDANGDANPLGVEVEIGGSGGTDTTSPVLSLLAPSGTLAAGTTNTTLSFVTDEAALCRYSTSPGTAYALMTNNFSTALSQSHSATVSGLENGGSYTYYVRCIDGSGNLNTSDATISFSVASSTSPAGVLSWEYSTYFADRSDGRIPINIIRTGGSTGTVTAQWSSNGQTATHNVDYYGNDSATVTFADGVTSVPINTYGSGENGIEMIANGATDDRYFQMILSNPTGGATLGTTLATVTINGQPVVRGLRISAGAMPVGVGSTKITPIQ